MILLFSLICPNGHPVGGEPKEYPGTEKPPHKWMENMSRQFQRKIESEPGEWKECQICHEPLRRGCGIRVGEMKAQTMEEAHRMLSSVSFPPVP